MQALSIRPIQFDIVWENPTANLEQLQSFLDLSLNDELVVLPEMFATGFTMQPVKFAQSMNGEIVQWMKQNSLGKMVCGSVAIEENGKYYNRFLGFENGELKVSYDKHQLVSHGRENQFYHAGNKTVAFEYKGWNIKPYICYDLRFPAWCRNREEADLMIFCANWPAVRIQAWNALLQARAIENQCYVLGVNRIGEDGKGIAHNGQSKLFNWMGDCIMDYEAKKSDKAISISADGLKQQRKEFPVLQDADIFIFRNNVAN